MKWQDALLGGHGQIGSLAIGNFDGVHLGHQAVLGLLRRTGAGGPVAVLVPDPHPLAVLGQAPPLLTPLPERGRWLLRHGADLLLRLPFDANVARMEPEEFVDSVIADAIAPEHVAVGFNFTFGRGGLAGSEDLCRLLQRHGIGCSAAPAVLVDGVPVSSSRVRQALQLGLVEEAARLLGRAHALCGPVRPGQGRGRTIGFPTANVHLPEGLALPLDGVYAVRCEIDSGEVPGVANFGPRPTFDEAERVLEVHLFGDPGDLYGQQMRVAFTARLRGQMRFATVDALRGQIAEDARLAKEMLGVAGA